MNENVTVLGSIDNLEHTNDQNGLLENDTFRESEETSNEKTKNTDIPDSDNNDNGIPKSHGSPRVQQKKNNSLNDDLKSVTNNNNNSNSNSNSNSNNNNNRNSNSNSNNNNNSKSNSNNSNNNGNNNSSNSNYNRDNDDRSCSHLQLPNRFRTSELDTELVDLSKNSILKFGVGTFYFFVSLVPSSFLWIVKALGFRADRKQGVKLLTDCFVERGPRGSLPIPPHLDTFCFSKTLSHSFRKYIPTK
jgi:hypothetical protein